MKQEAVMGNRERSVEILKSILSLLFGFITYKFFELTKGKEVTGNMFELHFPRKAVSESRKHNSILNLIFIFWLIVLNQPGILNAAIYDPTLDMYSETCNKLGYGGMGYNDKGDAYIVLDSAVLIGSELPGDWIIVNNCFLPREYWKKYLIDAYWPSLFEKKNNFHPKNNGQPKSCPVGNPINSGTGNKFLTETDYQSKPSILGFSRSYNSIESYTKSEIGNGWNHNFQKNIYYSDTSAPIIASILRKDGKVFGFQSTNNINWNANEDDIHDILERLFDTDGVTPVGWRYTTEDDTVERYNEDGKLQSITDIKGNTQTLSYNAETELLETITTNSGKSLTFSYDASNRIETITNHTGQIWGYHYDVNNNLEYVDNPDSTIKQYHYEDSNFLNALTGITDERGIRYATYEYDASGKAVASYHAGNAQRVDISYNDTDGTRQVTNSRGQSSTYSTATQLGVALVTDISGPGCSTCGTSNTSYNYDPANNNLLSKTENGITTRYGNYNSKGNFQCKVEGITASDTTDFTANPCGFDPAASPDARRTDYTYDPRFHNKVATITELSVFSGGNKVTTHSYDEFGNHTSATISGFTSDGTSVNRTANMNYAGPLNQISFIDGPRLDVNDYTTFDYHLNDISQGNNRARLKSVADANNVFVRNNIQYTPTGKIQSEDRPNGLSLSYSYYPGNDRLQTMTETAGTGSSISSRTTHWTYLATGEVQSITQGYGSSAPSTLTFGYDDARRLIRITDGLLDNYIQYTLDTEGNKEKEEIFDANGTPTDDLDDVLIKQLIQTFDIYNRLDISTQITGTTNEVNDNNFAPNGTLEQLTGGNNSVTDYGYDDLKRLLTSTHDFGTNADTSDDLLTQYGYDIADRLTSVTDPNGNATTYSYDDLGNLLSQTSPDTGTTTFSYDATGNLKTKTEGVGTPDERTTSYSYDALNRLTSIDALSAGDDITYTYDTCINGSGRLCTVQTGSLTTFYQYDGFGQVTGHQGTSYGYDATGRVTSITYPSGAQLTYGYDTNGQISRADLTINGQTQTLASNIQYAPFGPMTNLTYGNGKALNQTFDTAYRSTGISIPDVLDLTHDLYDGNGNLKQRTDILTTATDIFNYDSANRLDTANNIDTFGTRDYDYDKNGNRTQLIADTITTPYDHEPLGSGTANNRLRQIGAEDVLIDVFGNTLTRGNWTYSYTIHNRLGTATQGATLKAIFVYNSLGQRQHKSDETNATGRHFLYGLNGALLAETDQHGNVLKEYIYLNGVPLAVFEPDDDADGLTNAEEAIPTPENPQGTNPTIADRDGDSLTNLQEWFTYNTDANNRDTDGDEVSDNIEIAQGTDPFDSETYPGDGDVNQDGQVNLADLLLVTQFAVRQKNPDADELLYGDMNQDGAINVVDVLLLQKQLLVSALFNDPWFNEQWLGKPQTTSIASIKPSSLQDKNTLASIINILFPQAEAALPVNAGKLYYIHNDHLGTPKKLTDQNGTVIWSASHDPFGKGTVDASSTIEFNLRFPGQYYDAETNLHYNYYRTYDPETGRYLTSDPIGLRGGLNIYRYAGENPVNLVDPLGLAPVCPPGNRAVPMRNYENEFPKYFDCTPYYGNKPKPGPFGPICGPEGSVSAYWIPDVSPEACRKHDKCYGICGKTKEQCDLELCTNGTCLYGFLLDGALSGPSKKIYDKAQKENGCDECNK